MTIKKILGRPRLPKGVARSVNLQIRLTEAERALIEAKAKSDKKDLSEWVREAVLGEPNHNRRSTEAQPTDNRSRTEPEPNSDAV
jgi:hypothetical protein